MEIHRKNSNQNDNNCFMTSLAEQDETFLYDEAEQLLYNCSEKSFPAMGLTEEQLEVGCTTDSDCDVKTSTQKNNIWKESGAVRYFSLSSLRKPTKSQFIPSAAPSESPSQAACLGVDENGITSFEQAIIRKFKEISMLSQVEQSGVNPKPSREVHRRQQIISNLEEIYVRKSPFWNSSSADSNPKTPVRPNGEEVFSNSDFEDATKRPKSGPIPSESTKKAWDAKIKFIAQQHQLIKKELQAPVQSWSPRSLPNKPLMKAATNAMSPCDLFVQEIRKSNLVMKEDIFSTSRIMSDDSILKHEADKRKKKEEEEDKTDVPTKNVMPQEETSELSRYTMPKEEKSGILTRNPMARSFSPWRRGPLDAVEVFETVGGRIPSIKQVERNQRLPDEWTSRLNHSRSQGPGQRGGRSGCGQRKAIREQNDHKEDDETKKMVTRTGVSPFTQLNAIKNPDLKELSTGTSVTTPLSKFVKLPCFPEAFGTHDCNVKELRIKDGISFESITSLEKMTTVTDSGNFGEAPGREPDEVIEGNMVATTGVTLISKLGGTKDASTSPQVTNVDRVTQTHDSKNSLHTLSTASVSVQCDSRVLITNDEGTHKEIMICNDDGTGVQLYNSLGFPLTDMDGYLLKDTHGRFLVRLDPLGVPVSCTNGEEISVEDGSAWDTVKEAMNVIHQVTKKKIIQKPAERKFRETKKDKSASLQQISNAMRNLTTTVDWTGKFSPMDTSYDPSASVVYIEPSDNLKQLKNIAQPSLVAKNAFENSSNLVEEMKSIAKLRNALLEKVNFIAIHRKTPGIIPGYVTKSARNAEASHVQKTSEVKWPGEPSVGQNQTTDYLRDFKCGRSFHSEFSKPDDTGRQYPWMSSAKPSLTPCDNKLPRIENFGTLELKTLQDDKRLKEVSVVDRFFEKEPGLTWQPSLRRDRQPQRDVSSESQQRKKMDDSVRNNWSDSRPAIRSTSESSNSFFR